jgi:hypothetical protein
LFLRQAQTVEARPRTGYLAILSTAELYDRQARDQKLNAELIRGQDAAEQLSIKLLKESPKPAHQFGIGAAYRLYIRPHNE